MLPFGLVAIPSRLTDRPSMACCQLRTSCPQPFGPDVVPLAGLRDASSSNAHRLLGGRSVRLIRMSRSDTFFADFTLDLDIEALAYFLV